MTDNTFPIGRYSRNDVESALNNEIDTTFQTVNTANPSTFIKDYYGMNFLLGNGGSGVLDKWIPFQKPIQNIVAVYCQPAGVGAGTSPTSGLGTQMSYYTAAPAVVMTVAGLSKNGFTAQITSAVDDYSSQGVFYNNSAYVFFWHAIARVR